MLQGSNGVKALEKLVQMFLGYADYEANECLKQGTCNFTCSYSCAYGSEFTDFGFRGCR